MNTQAYLGHPIYLNSGPLTAGEGEDEIFFRIFESFYNLQNSHKKTNREELTIFDLTPNGRVDKDLVLDITYFTLITQEVFGFRKEKIAYDGDMGKIEGSRAKMTRLRERRKIFFQKTENGNRALPYVLKIWDIVPSIALLTTAHFPNEKRIGTRPKNLDEFAERIASASQDSTLKGTTRLARCHFGKMILATAMALDNRSMEQADKEIHDSLKRIREIKGIIIEKDEYGSLQFRFQGKGVDGQPLSYTGNITYRIKAIEKIILKMLYNREYTDINKIMDLGGIRIVLDNISSPELNQQARVHAVQTFSEAIFPKNIHKKRDVRMKGKFLSEEKYDNLMKMQGFSARTGGNKGITEKGIQNVSVVNESSKLELQVEEKGNMDSFFDSPEWNDTKKLLSSATRDMLVISVYNLTLLLEVFLPSYLDQREGFIKKAIIKLIHDGQLLVGTTPEPQGEFGFVMKDVYTEEYRTFYTNYPLEFMDVSSNPPDVMLLKMIDDMRKNKKYIRVLEKTTHLTQDAYKALNSYSFEL